MQNLWYNIQSFIIGNDSLWSFLVTISTIVYVVLTYRLLKETVKARKLQYKPYVIVDFEVKTYYLKMVIKNIGNDAALNVNINTSPAINNDIKNLEFIAPGREISNIIMYLFDDGKVKDTKFFIDISYEDLFKQKYTHKYNFDISTLLKITQFNESDLKPVVDSLSKIHKEINTLSTAIKNIKFK